MKIKLRLLAALQFLTICCFSQNIGIGTAEPMNKLQVMGNLLINTPTTATAAAPTLAQTGTMINGSTIGFAGSDSTARIYDPGGPGGNYNINQLCYVDVGGAPGGIGLEVTAETMGLGTGDSLIIVEGLSASAKVLLAVGNGYTNTGRWIINCNNPYIIFKSNFNASTGIGFSLLIKRLYDNSAALPGVSGFTGKALSFDAKDGSLRAGWVNNSAIGNYSTALGNSNSATGDESTALGYRTVASGAMSTAMGNGTIASGIAATAMGGGTIASGNTATAIGYYATASGVRSTAMGSYVNTNNYNGAFLIGDNSTTTVMNGTTPNNFRARFDGGYRFYTSSDYSTSCALSPGANAWSTTSDVNSKENFASINGEDFLRKISGFHLTSWNYKKQDSKTFRHYGPMAQDFYAAFGKDEYGTIGNDTTINSADFAGVSFIAIQALEKRTQKIKQLERENTNQGATLEEIKNENALLKNENTEMKAMLLQLRKEMDELNIKNIASPKIL
jgi:hypothetical protein